MAIPKRSLQGEWGGQLSFVLALAGASIGLSSIWSFPALAVTHGGGAFLLVYGLFLVLLIVPVYLAEIGVGRSMRRGLADGVARLAREQGSRTSWAAAGWVAVTVCGGLLVVHILAGGWIGAWTHALLADPWVEFDEVTSATLIASVLAEPDRLLLWSTLAALTVALVVGLGLRTAIEPVLRALVTGLLVLMTGLVLWAAAFADMAAAWERVFRIRPDALGWDGVRAAGQHALLSTAAALGIATAFGASLPDRYPTLSTAGAAVALHAVVGLLAALMAVSLLLSHGSGSVATGPALVFHALPRAILDTPGGRAALVGLFAVLLIAVVTTAIALMEVVVRAVVEQGRVRRAHAAVLVGSAAWALGLVGLVALASVTGGEGLAAGAGTPARPAGVLALLPWLLIPLLALVIVLFAGWCMPPETLRGALRLREDWRFDVWIPVLRYVAPLILLGLLATVAGLLPL